MGLKSGVSARGYHPAIYAMHESMRLREQLQEEQIEMICKQQEERKALLQVETDTIYRCMESEGRESFLAWYESDAVPNYGPIQGRIDLIEARIKSLEFQTITTRIQQVEESLQAVEAEFTGAAYEVARRELMSELIELGDKLQVYETVG